ncbi:S-layer protein [Synechococcus sp. 63AY4M2]|uniref:S-layer homology domain-containing protein n=1 Tax=unclassified Synechococcus TaxID=2626047 RepID=UPI0000694430|nr:MULTISPECIES: S-layer homology domain-containing protein [unclassified Synechococcus]ABC99653.1 S-layer domain protein [Synechococcus sp. JA-3-3Ab]PIK85065.1 S-layer protein [Synechococcus sp. 63AY4M2]PIK92749.1 S-layer protein [Synechococcus sp. 65AY6Li]PIK98691.1 S-layer protein [Synechococcus sp. 63AY4M1]
MGSVEGEKALQHQLNRLKQSRRSLPPAGTWLRAAGFALLLGLLSACQGTEWGERLQRAVRPVGLPPPLSADRPETPTPLPGSRSPSAPATPPASFTPPPSQVSSRFTDLEPGSLVARAVSDLDRLGVFADIVGSEFQPQRSVRRGEFARWLVLANNVIHADQPSRQIRLGSAGERPLFLDVPEEDPNFRYIQALGAAGLVVGDANREFRPNSLLSRAELIRMKAPLDLPPGQIKGSRAELEERWGFTDAAQIPDEAVAPLVADRSLENASTVLRTFGPIRTFNPFEPVSRGEAAIALSAFGERTAQEAALPTPTPAAEPPDPEPSPPVAEPDQTPSPPPTPEGDPSPSATGNSKPPAVTPGAGEIVTPREPQP